MRSLITLFLALACDASVGQHVVSVTRDPASEGAPTHVRAVVCADGRRLLDRRVPVGPETFPLTIPVTASRAGQPYGLTVQLIDADGCTTSTHRWTETAGELGDRRVLDRVASDGCGECPYPSTCDGTSCVATVAPAGSAIDDLLGCADALGAPVASVDPDGADDCTFSAIEACNGLDEDCDGRVDEGTGLGAPRFACSVGGVTPPDDCAFRPTGSVNYVRLNRVQVSGSAEIDAVYVEVAGRHQEPPLELDPRCGSTNYLGPDRPGADPESYRVVVYEALDRGARAGRLLGQSAIQGVAADAPWEWRRFTLETAIPLDEGDVFVGFITGGGNSVYRRGPSEGTVGSLGGILYRIDDGFVIESDPVPDDLGTLEPQGQNLPLLALYPTRALPLCDRRP